MTLETTATTSAAQLQERLGALIHLPGDALFDAMRMPWNVAVDQRPAAVATPATADEVAAIVTTAAELGLRIAPQSSGHGAAALSQHSLDDVVLLRTLGLTGVEIDAEQRVARVGGGVLWDDVVTAAAAHGLAALHGSSPDVAVAGYTLGGGIGWYARKHGLASNSLVAVEIVTADGQLLRASDEENADLFWAIRGGGGNFGVVTSLELRLFDIRDAYAGFMLWDIAHAEKVVRRWAEWTRTTPDEVSSSLRILRLPPLPELPDFLRGQTLVVVDGAVLGDDAFGQQLLAGLRELQPHMDTFARVPAPAVTRIHMDPEGPTPGEGDGTLLADLDDAAIDAFLAVAGPGVTSSLLSAELRQLGGVLSRPAEHGGALSHLDGAYALYGVGIAPFPEAVAQVRADAARLLAALAPWASGATYLNFAETPVDPHAAYAADAWTRLQQVQAQADPNGVFVANHRIG
ncbi:FAD-binding oxidoreductase [Lysobacter korlensis]|uniref:FAD-binding oxidoreductase n=1 Tax=Lysobacter korlensis TaxID=553636 RepID=A0ABV6RXS4_9GAMM